MAERKTINSLQGLRALMVSFVVISHVFVFNVFYNRAGEAMHFFFVLSGFVLTYAYIDKVQSISISSIFDFMKKRIKKLYPLYFLFTFIMFGYFVVRCVFIINNSDSVIRYVKALISNALFLQVWIKDTSLAPGSWFVANIMFSYLLFLPTLKIVQKSNKKNAFLGIICLVSAFLIWNFLFINVVKTESTFFTYYFPVNRFFEFVIGMFLAKVFLSYNQISDEKKVGLRFTILEIFAVVFFVVEKILFPRIGISDIVDSIIPVFDLIVTVLLIYVFAFEKGILSKAVSNKLFLAFAGISFEVFIVHQSFQLILASLCVRLGIIRFYGIITIIISILFAIVWKKLNSFLSKKRKKV